KWYSAGAAWRSFTRRPGRKLPVVGIPTRRGSPSAFFSRRGLYPLADLWGPAGGLAGGRHQVAPPGAPPNGARGCSGDGRTGRGSRNDRGAEAAAGAESRAGPRDRAEVDPRQVREPAEALSRLRPDAAEVAQESNRRAGLAENQGGGQLDRRAAGGRGKSAGA